MRIYDIWSEGSYWEGHPRHKDFFVASIRADSFDDAVRDYIKSYAVGYDIDPQIEKREDGWVWVVGHKVCKLYQKIPEVQEIKNKSILAGNSYDPEPIKPHKFKYSTAIDLVLVGNRVARTEWVDRNQYLFLMKSEMFDSLELPYGIRDNDEVVTDQIWIKTSKGLVGPYSGCNCDIMAEDWELY